MSRKLGSRLKKAAFRNMSAKRKVHMLEKALEEEQLKCHMAENITKTYLKLKEHLQEESLTFEAEIQPFQNMNHQAHLTEEAAKAQQELLHPDELNSKAQRSATGVGEEERVLSSFEGTFQHIREATEVTNTQEMVDRLIYKKDTQKHLEEMKVENEAKLLQLKEERDTLEAQFQEMKYSGETNLSRAHQEFEGHLKAEQQRHIAAKEKLEQLTQKISTVSKEMEHLTDNVQHITLSDECVQSDTADRIVKLLQEGEHKLQHLQEELQDKDPHTLMKEMEEEEFRASIEGKLPQYNTRITLPNTQRSDLYEEEENSGEDEGDIITRTSLKHESQLLIDSKTRRKTHLKKKRGKL